MDNLACLVKGHALINYMEYPLKARNYLCYNNPDKYPAICPVCHLKCKWSHTLKRWVTI